MVHEYFRVDFTLIWKAGYNLFATAAAGATGGAGSRFSRRAISASSECISPSSSRCFSTSTPSGRTTLVFDSLKRAARVPGAGALLRGLYNYQHPSLACGRYSG
ncbi:MAG: hypothetical protein WKG07_01575 [Hymenobacter sp.]